MASGDVANVIEPRHLFPGQIPVPAGGLDTSATFQDATRQFQRQLIANTLDTAGWNVSEAARRLDLARSYLYDLIKAHGLQRS